MPDLVIVDMVNDADLAGGYQNKPFNFQNFGVNRIELKRNGTSLLRGGYTPNFANGQYLKAYITFLQELECDTGDKSISLTRPSGPTNTHYTRSKSPTVQSDPAPTVYDPSQPRDLRA